MRFQDFQKSKDLKADLPEKGEKGAVGSLPSNNYVSIPQGEEVDPQHVSGEDSTETEKTDSETVGTAGTPQGVPVEEAEEDPLTVLGNTILSTATMIPPKPNFTYDLQNPKNVLAEMNIPTNAELDNDDPNVITKTKIFKSFPNQIKYLFMVATGVIAKAANIRKPEELLLYGTGEPALADGPLASAMYFYNFLNIMQVEIFDGYASSDDATGRSFVSKSNWKLLTQDMYNSMQGKQVLCRLRRWTDPYNVIKAYATSFVEMPVFNEYFMLNFSGEASNVINTLPEAILEGDAADLTDATDFTMAEGEAVSLGDTNAAGGLELDSGGQSQTSTIIQGGGYSI